MTSSSPFQEIGQLNPGDMAELSQSFEGREYFEFVQNTKLDLFASSTARMSTDKKEAVFTLLSSIGVVPFEGLELAVEHSLVGPGEQQRLGWHFDNLNKSLGTIVLSNCLPTQALVGKGGNYKAFSIKKRLYMRAVMDGRIGLSKLDRFDDDELTAFGFSVVSPKPYEIAWFDAGKELHRSPVNNSQHSHQRFWARVSGVDNRGRNL